jgi:Ca-activated chloride channel homolog
MWVALSELEHLRFAWPIAFALLAVPVAVAILQGRPGSAPSLVFSSTASILALSKKTKKRPGLLRISLPFLTLVLTTVALARPQIVQRISSAKYSGVDIMLVLDATPTMLAQDFTIGGEPASRVDAVVYLAREFVRSRPHDRIGMLFFAAYPLLLSPPTLNHDWLEKSLTRVEVRDATAIGSAIASAANQLKDSTAKSKLIVVLTDGDNNYGRIEPRTAAEAAGALGIQVYAIGIGSDHPVPIPGYGYAQAILNDGLLRDVARLSHGQYFRARGTEDLKKTFAEIDRLEKSDYSSEEHEDIKELYEPPALASLMTLAGGFLLTYGLSRRFP